MGYSSSRDQEHSSMRLNFMIATFACGLLLFTVSLYIIMMVFNGQGADIDWTGLGVFALGLLGGLTGMGFAKSDQKRHETKITENGKS